MGPHEQTDGMGPDDSDEWFEQQEPDWIALRLEGIRRFPPGSLVSDGAGRHGRVLVVDPMGDLHIEWEDEGVAVASIDSWDQIARIEEGPR